MNSKNENIDQILTHVKFIINKMLELAEYESKNVKGVNQNLIIANWIIDKFLDSMQKYKNS